jgi:pimeloyl-ACP methyl ester carboxylesterase
MGEINKPILLINGRMDKITDYVLEPIFYEVPKIRWITMDNSSHMPFWEERERFTDLVDKWLRGLTSQSGSVDEIAISKA